MPSDKLSPNQGVKRGGISRHSNLAFKAMGVFLLGLASLSAAPKKSVISGKSAVPVASPAKPAAETVYVSTPPQSAASEATSSNSMNKSTVANREPEERRKRSAASLGPLRNFGHSYGLAAGFYSAEVLGNNPFATLIWNLYSDAGPTFFEFTSGIGTVQSSLSKSMVGGGVFPHSYMISFEALGGYTYTGLAKGPGQSGGLFPYFMGGITAIYQGGVPNIGAVLAFGNRMNIPFGPTNGIWALNYGVRDHIYSQKIRSSPSMTQNFVVLIGIQKYY